MMYRLLEWIHVVVIPHHPFIDLAFGKNDFALENKIPSLPV